MKNKITLSVFTLFLLLSTASRVLAQPYYFSRSNGTYTDLTGATVANGTTVWDNQFFTIPIGFSFDFWGLSVDSLMVRDIGVMFDQLFARQVEVFSADLCDRGIGTPASISPIGYTVTGTAGSQIFKLEWKNAGFKGEYTASSTTNDFVNVQLWLYEGSNNIEVRTGSNSVNDPANEYWAGKDGPVVGLTNTTILTYYKLDGSPTAPVPVNADSSLDGTPSSGMIYLFSTTPIAIEDEIISSSLNVFPSPASGTLNVNLLSMEDERFSVSLIDVTGKTIAANSDWMPRQEQTLSFDVSDLAPGIYFIRVEGSLGGASKKVVIE